MHLLQHIPIPPDGAFRPFRDDEIEQSLSRRFEQQVQGHGDRLAIKWNRGQYSYSSLNETANRLARALLAVHGPAAEPVALLFEHDGDALAAILAVLKAGKFYVVLDPDYPADRLKYMLDDSGAALMIAGGSHVGYARTLCGSTIGLIDFNNVESGLSGADLDTSPAPESLAMIMYTSGSTGRPKGVLHTHRSVLADARNITNGYCAGARDRWLLAASLSFANSLRTIYGALLNGAALYPIDVRKRGFGEHASWLLDNDITIIRAVPTMFRRFMATLDEHRTFPSVRVLAVGGEPMLQADLIHFNRHFSPNCVLLHAFGPTECLSVCWALVPHGTQVADGKLPIGYSVPDKDVQLLDESRQAVADGKMGQIAVRSRYLSPGYWRDPERTRASFLPDPTGGDARIYLTGDFGRREPDGRLVHLGRQDFQVKIRGYRIDVSEIENALRAIEGISDAVVVGREMNPGDQRLIAYCVSMAQSPVAASALRRALAQKLPDYMIPSAFVAMEALPRTPNGKTDRLSLPPPQRNRRELDTPLTLPRSAIEVELAAIWVDIIGIDEVGIDDTILELGGDSLQAAMIATRVGVRFGLELPASALLKSGTVAQIATLVAASLRNVSRSDDRCDSTGDRLSVQRIAPPPRS